MARFVIHPLGVTHSGGVPHAEPATIKAWRLLDGEKYHSQIGNPGSEEHLAEKLRQYPFVLVPAGALDSDENNRGVANLSLPGRILFAVASSHTPILFVGSDRTCGARFIRHFGVGEIVPYDAAAIRAAIDRLTSPDIQQQMRRNAALIAQELSDRGLVEWMTRSIAMGRPVDRRFEDLFEGYDADVNLVAANDSSRAQTEGAEDTRRSAAQV